MATDIQDSIQATWNFRDPAASEQAFVEMQKELSVDHIDYWLVQTQVARTYSLRRQFDSAHAMLDDVQQQLTNHGPALTVRYCLERGRSFNSSGKPQEACPLFEQALQVAQENNLEGLAIDAAHMLGIAAAPSDRLQWNLKTIAMIESSELQTVKGWLPSLYNNTGWTYFDEQKLDLALAMFDKSLAWHSERNTGEGHRIAIWCVARCLREMGQHKEALEMQLDILARAEAEQADPSGYTHEELAELYDGFGEITKACTHASIAHEALAKDEWFVANEKARLDRMKVLSQHCDDK